MVPRALPALHGELICFLDADSEGFGPHFGLYSVNYTSYARAGTEGADALHAIAAARQVPAAQRQHYGGPGPMTPEAGFPLAPFCPKTPAS